MLKTVHILSVIFILTLTITSSACADHIRYTANADSGTVFELIFQSEKPEVLKPLPVKLTITDKHGNRVTGSEVACSLTMPAMAMPANTPKIQATDIDGQYSSIFLLTMGGLWYVELTATYPSGNNEHVIIPIPGVVSESDSDVDAKLEEMFHEKSNTN